MADTLESVDQEGLVRLLLDLIHRSVLHHGLWFTEVRHQMGPPKARDLLFDAWRRSSEIQTRRLAKILGFSMKNGLPGPLMDMPRDRLLAAIEGVAANWLANDGVWFQAVESDSGMNDAKRCNDGCWAHFSPLEAESIRHLLDLGDRPGLDGLKIALGYRLYARLNIQSIHDQRPESFVFQMNECRVQAARRRKGMPDYPCKSAGLVEYAYFARTIDPRIVTECIGCPPDEHPDRWYCAWRFSIAQEPSGTAM